MTMLRKQGHMQMCRTAAVWRLATMMSQVLADPHFFREVGVAHAETAVVAIDS